MMQRSSTQCLHLSKASLCIIFLPGHLVPCALQRLW